MCLKVSEIGTGKFIAAITVSVSIGEVRVIADTFCTKNVLP